MTTFINLKKRVASNIGYVDSSGDISTTRDVTETDIGNWVNDRYRDDLVPEIMEQYPEDYEQTSTAPFYKTTSTIATIDSTTLTIEDANFNTGMVGDRIYSGSDEDTQTIASYTSTTVVVLDAAMSGWAVGDTVYVLGHEFAIGGSATDMRTSRWVGVKYDSTAEFYTRAEYVDQNKLFQTGGETYSAAYPVWYFTTSAVSSVPTTTIGILPEPTTAHATGIQMRYAQLPAAMSDDDDVPRIPLGSHSALVKGATADCLRKMRRFDEARVYEMDFMREKQLMIENYGLTRMQGTARVYPPRKVRLMEDGTI